MIRYQVRSKELIDIVGEISSSRLILSPYFQRNLVWRDVHKRDFIETILKGYPFPQIFIARGEIDVETMTAQSCVVDGQQRLNAIMEYVEDEYSVNGQLYSQLDQAEKEAFLKYQVPVIDLEMKATDPSVIDVFQRLNRTFYSLSAIERMSTEYSSVDFMLIAKYVCGFFETVEQHDDGDGALQSDPNMPPEFLPWAQRYDVEHFRCVVTGGRVFSGYENSRMVHLMWTLNVLSTLRVGFFPRNDKTRELLDADYDSTPNRDALILTTSRAGRLFCAFEFDQDSIWWNKSNSFSSMVLICWHIDVLEAAEITETRRQLIEFEKEVSEEYALSAREAVNNLRQRRFRHRSIARALGLTPDERPFDP